MPNPFKGKKPAIHIQKQAYAMASVDGSTAEITMYGDIYEQQPTNWYGEPVDGQFITLSEFLSDLEQLRGCMALTIRIHSYGGDAGVSNTIHNRLRELSRNGTALTCIVDGVAMSGGSLIMCACDTVKVNPSSLIMIHKCWCFLWGGYNADELREQATQQDAWDKMQLEIYQRKTGLSPTVLSHMMANTTYMTGREAVEKGFADQMLEDAEPVSIAASADGRSLFVGGRQLHLTPGMFVPDNIPTVTSEAAAPVKTDHHTPAQPGKQNGGIIMAKTLEELRKEDPALADQLMAEARAAVSSPTPGTSADAINAAVQAEQKRIQEIDEIAGLYDAEVVEAAKYGEHVCTAQEMAYRAAQKAAKQGCDFLAAAQADAAASGASSIGAVPPIEAGENPIEQARADARAFNARKKGVR